MEVPVETPLQSKLDVSRFRRILIAGFVTDLRDSDVDLSAETSRLLQNQLRSNTRIQVLEPDRPPLDQVREAADAPVARAALPAAADRLAGARQAVPRRR